MVSIILKVIIIYREKKATPDVKAQTFVLAKKSKQNDKSIKTVFPDSRLRLIFVKNFKN